MKRIALLFVIVVSILWVTACGSPAPAATQAPAQPAVTEAPTSQSSPAEVSPVANDTQVNIILADNTIKSSQTTFQVGVPYTFVIMNTGQHAHNFNISTPVSIAGSLNAALSGALLTVDKNQLSVGASVTVKYTFSDSAAGQQLEFSCLIQKHYSDGMKLAITVTK